MTLVSASNGGNGTMSTFNNIISLTDALSIGTVNIGAASTTTNYAMLFGESNTHVTLVEVELSGASYVLKSSGDIKTVEFNALKTAKGNSDVIEVSSASFFPQNVITVSGTTGVNDLTIDKNGAAVGGSETLPTGKIILYYLSQRPI